LRSIRLCLSDSVRPLFKEQLRGLLRASVHGKLRIMFPMISGVGELRQVRALLDEARSELRAEGHPVSDELQIGIMIEMPSAAVVADHLAREVDFFSIGTNDLIQYTLAVDRVNEHVAYLYEPLHPALLRLVHGVVKAAEAAQISCSLCGEMAGDPDVALVLLGMGVEELSMNAVAIPEIKRTLRGHDAAELRRLVAPALDLPTAREVREHLRAGLGRKLSGDT
jgi:phosphotransferase system enzyme I (PtsI)